MKRRKKTKNQREKSQGQTEKCQVERTGNDREMRSDSVVLQEKAEWRAQHAPSDRGK